LPVLCSISGDDLYCQTGLDMAKQASQRIDTAQLQALLSRCAQGDQSAFEDLYHATKAKIFATALLVMKRRHLAEEVVQEAYVRIWTKASAYEPSRGSPIAWMATITRNLAIDVVRRPQFEMQIDEVAPLDPPSTVPTVLEEIEHFQSQNNAFAALQNLDPMSRRLIVAAYMYGESRENLSKRFGIPVNTIKTWIRRGLLETRASLANADDISRTTA
jgi:RNA polymerase sigma-70 factor, ECF subfamily